MRLLAVTLGCLLLGAALWIGVASGSPTQASRPDRTLGPTTTAVPEPAERLVSTTTTPGPAVGSPEPDEAAPRGEPVSVRVPIVEIGVALDPLGLDPEGALEVPEDFERGGWYQGGPRPGEAGPAVIAAHVDSPDGPAPFFRLQEMAAGDEIEVVYSSGDSVTFIATRVEQHPKDEFPTLEVYGNTNEAELRLVTCGGDFDRRHRSYRHNIIVWASQA